MLPPLRCRYRTAWLNAVERASVWASKFKLSDEVLRLGLQSAGTSRLLDDDGVAELFQLLRDNRPRTRAELAAVLGLSRSTVAIRVDKLMELGLIAADQHAGSSGGRPASQLTFNASGRLVAGVYVGINHAAVSLNDLTGVIRVQSRTNIQLAQEPSVVLQWAVQTIHDLLNRTGRGAKDLVGIGVGVPGPVEFRSGRPVNPPLMPGWHLFDIPGWIYEQIGVHAVVEDDVNITTLGVKADAWHEVRDFMFVTVADGIGSGIVIDGHLHRGAAGVAGDIAHIPISRGETNPCRCGNSGCLETVASGSACAASLRAAGVDAATSSDVVRLVRSGHTLATQIVRQAGCDIGDVLAMCVSILNPSVITLGGSLAEAGEHLLAGVREGVYSRLVSRGTGELVVAQARKGSDASLVGAGLLAINLALGPETYVRNA